MLRASICSPKGSGQIITVGGPLLQLVHGEVDVLLQQADGVRCVMTRELVLEVDEALVGLARLVQLHERLGQAEVRLHVQWVVRDGGIAVANRRVHVTGPGEK